MATTYYADNYVNQVQWNSAGADFTQGFLFTVNPALVINDLIYLSKIPAGVAVLDWMASITDLDSDVSPALQISIGDSGSATRDSSSAREPATSSDRSSPVSPARVR